MMSFYSRFKSREDASYDLLKFKVNEILLVSSHYDAFIFEQDGVLSEQLIGEFHQLNLSFPPRITHVTTVSGALDVLASRPVDLVMAGAMRNPYFIESAARTRQPVYAPTVTETA